MQLRFPLENFVTAVGPKTGMVSIPVSDGQKDFKIHQNNQFLLFVDVSVFIRDLHQKKKLVLVLLQNVMTLVLVPASSADETETSTESKNWLF